MLGQQVRQCHARPGFFLPDSALAAPGGDHLKAWLGPRHRAQWAAALHSACIYVRQTVIQPGFYTKSTQVCNICGGGGGRAEAAHLQKLPHGALLRAALSAGGLGRPQSSVQAAAGGPGLGVHLECCMLWALIGLGCSGGCQLPGSMAMVYVHMALEYALHSNL